MEKEIIIGPLNSIISYRYSTIPRRDSIVLDSMQSSTAVRHVDAYCAYFGCLEVGIGVNLDGIGFELQAGAPHLFTPLAAAARPALLPPTPLPPPLHPRPPLRPAACAAAACCWRRCGHRLTLTLTALPPKVPNLANGGEGEGEKEIPVLTPRRSVEVLVSFQMWIQGCIPIEF